MNRSVAACMFITGAFASRFHKVSIARYVMAVNGWGNRPIAVWCLEPVAELWLVTPSFPKPEQLPGAAEPVFFASAGKGKFDHD